MQAMFCILSAPQTYEKLVVAVGDKPNTVCVNKALGDESGVSKTMYCETVNTGMSNSLLKAKCA